MPKRWLGDSTKPPVPGVEASRKVNGETQTALPVVLMICSRVIPLSRNWVGVTSTCSCCSRWPQMDTFATPAMPISRGLIFHRARTDISMPESCLEFNRTISTRLVEDIGCMRSGGVETLGRACACVIRSATSWRARRRSVPGSKTSSIDDSPGTDFDRISSSHATPLRRSASIGEVMSCSISTADRPKASVWISTCAGANSGMVSTAMCGTLTTPRAMSPAARASTRMRNWILNRVTQPNMASPFPGGCRGRCCARTAEIFVAEQKHSIDT
ncbi:hypothetical protein QFZ69_001812 [Arthrobacter sp. V1I7]|nr:hypothetical protein [Arthrobacter sp. V1I7]